jgi:hypothetical protein
MGPGARLAGDCALAFEAAVIDLERAEHDAASGADVDRDALGAACATFERLRAAPWPTRAERASQY